MSYDNVYCLKTNVISFMNIRLLRSPTLYLSMAHYCRKGKTMLYTQQLPIRNQKASGDWGECNICEAEFIFQSMRNKLKNENTEH